MGKVSKALHKAATGLTPPTDPPPLFRERKTSGDSVDQASQINADTPSAPDTAATTGSLNNLDERLLGSTDSLSGIAESFRKLRTLILHPDKGPSPRTIMVLSAEPQEGKSFVCANLGISISHDFGHKALLLDCDLRRPSLHTLFGLHYPKGLSDYLRDGEDISNLIVATGLPKLSLIPSGSPPDNPSELISSEKMSQAINELAARYDDRLIILDTPPFQAAAETLILAQLVDKIVLVVRWGKTGREVIKKMADTVAPEKIVGIVFNAFEMNILDKKMQGVGYHTYYSEGYY